AALFVKVTARMASEGTPFSRTRWAMRWVMTRVLPLPAPARMRTGPSVARTASRCCGFRPLRRGESSADTGRSDRNTRTGSRLVQSGGALTHRSRWAFATPPQPPLALRAGAALLHRDRLGEVPRLVHVAARATGGVIGHTLQ